MEKLTYDIKPTWVRDAQVDQEVDRFLEALHSSKEQLLTIRQRIASTADSEHVQIIDAHLMIMEDNILVNETVEYIKRHRLSAEWSLKRVLDKLRERFNKMEDSYLKDRKDDITHIGNRIFNNLLGYSHTNLADLREDVVVVAHDLSPADTAQMRKERVIGFVTEVGSKTSHTAIMAHSLEIPACGRCNGYL